LSDVPYSRASGPPDCPRHALRSASNATLDVLGAKPLSSAQISLLDLQDDGFKHVDVGRENRHEYGYLREFVRLHHRFSILRPASKSAPFIDHVSGVKTTGDDAMLPSLQRRHLGESPQSMLGCRIGAGARPHA